MSPSTAPTPRPTLMKESLEMALAESTDPEVRFHLRQALQMVV